MLSASPPLPAVLLERPICELLLDQRLFNGVGNYLRAEILYRAKLPPFSSARDALEHAARHPEAAGDVLACTRSTLAYAVRHKGKPWLDTYGRFYARQEIDGHGRTIWFRGDRGPLPPSVRIVNGSEGSCSSIFVGRLSERLDKEQATCGSDPSGCRHMPPSLLFSPLLDPAAMHECLECLESEIGRREQAAVPKRMAVWAARDPLVCARMVTHAQTKGGVGCKGSSGLCENGDSRSTR